MKKHRLSQAAQVLLQQKLITHRNNLQEALISKQLATAVIFGNKKTELLNSFIKEKFRLTAGTFLFLYAPVETRHGVFYTFSSMRHATIFYAFPSMRHAMARLYTIWHIHNHRIELIERISNDYYRSFSVQSILFPSLPRCSKFVRFGDNPFRVFRCYPQIRLNR